MSYLNHNLPTFTCYNRITKNPGYEIDLNEYTVENRRKIETSANFMYEVIEIRDRNPAKSSDSINQELK